MNNEIFEKYKKEMLEMYEKAKKNNGYIPVQVTPEPNTKAPPPNTAATPVPSPASPSQSTQTGGLLGIVTSFRGLYPAENARVTIFTGDIDNMQVIDSDFTDRSGRTKVFSLSAPDKNLSMSPDLAETPYSLYNMMVEADGFLKNIHLNIPVFSGITSIQRSDMILAEERIDKTPQIFDESQKYNL